MDEAQESSLPKDFQGYGLIQIFHGDGKGKTTAALGEAIRCAGSNRKVAIIYFDKGGEHYCERQTLKNIPNIDFWVTGRDRIDAQSGQFDFSITEIDRAEARRGLEMARQILTEDKYDLVVLDEINSTVALGMLDIESVTDIIDQKSDHVELILTGRNPKKELLSRAHSISEVKDQKHYYYAGVKARKGLDY